VPIERAFIIEVAARDGDENFADNRFPSKQLGRSKQEASPRKEDEERTNCVRHAKTTRTVRVMQTAKMQIRDSCASCALAMI
jgi:hypothetical protein